MKGKSQHRRVVGVLLAFSLATVGVIIVVGNMTPQGGDPSKGRTPVRTPSVSVPTPTVPTASASVDAPMNRQASVVQAAKESVEFLSTGSLDPTVREQYVNRYVAPTSRSQVAQTLEQLGPVLATSDYMGYDSVEMAAENAYYYELVLKYKMLKLTSDKATLSLFVETHWIDARGDEYQMLSTSTLRMQYAEGRWLYVSSQTDPVPDELQPKLQGATYDQSVELYRPYLKGYSDVSSVKDSGR